jgi:hypothetical protein
MEWHKVKRKNYGVLGVMALLATAYYLTVYFWRPLSTAHKIEGGLGILLGLFICSKPAANLLDMLFDLLSNRFQQENALRLTVWLASNFLILLVGWFIITLGATRFTAR